MRYLALLHARYGSWKRALAAYNWGPGAIDRRLAEGETPCPCSTPTAVYSRLRAAVAARLARGDGRRPSGIRGRGAESARRTRRSRRPRRAESPRAPFTSTENTRRSPVRARARHRRATRRGAGGRSSRAPRTVTVLHARLERSVAAADRQRGQELRPVVEARGAERRISAASVAGATRLRADRPEPSAITVAAPTIAPVLRR